MTKIGALAQFKRTILQGYVDAVSTLEGGPLPIVDGDEPYIDGGEFGRWMVGEHGTLKELPPMAKATQP